MRLFKKTRVKLFRPSFSTGDPVEKVAFFDWIRQAEFSQSKKVESKKPLSDYVRKPDWSFSRKRPSSTDKSDCIRNGLTSVYHLFMRS